MIRLIHFGGKDLPITFSHSAIMNFCDSEGVAAADQDLLFEGINHWSMKRAYKMFWFSIKEGCRKKKERFPWPEIEDFMDDVGQDEEFFNAAIKLFAEDMAPGEAGKTQASESTAKA